MSSSVLYMSMSLDGYIAGPDDEPGNPGGDGFMRLHEWYFADGESGRPSGPAGELADQMNATGAVLVGRRTAEQAGHYKGDHHGAPIFVLSHRPPGSGTCWCTVLNGAAGAGGRGAGRNSDPSDPGATRHRAPAVRHLAVADRTGDRPGDRHTAGHPHPLPCPPLSRPASPCRRKDNR